jgi:hypothetical protein
MALIGGVVLAHTSASSIHLLGARQDAIRNSIRVLDQGGPPLLTAQGGQPFPAEATDDPGIILILPQLRHVFGTSDPIQLLKWFFVVAFALLLAVYPILWFEVLSSAVAAVVAPIFVLLQFRFLAVDDVYWVAAWCLLLCVPCILLIYQRWKPISLALLVFPVLLASLASSIRSQAGLPILIAAVVVVLLRVRRWMPRLAFVVVLAVAYTAISGATMRQVRHYRDASVGVDLTDQYSSSHSLWHPAYLGLGFIANNYGISWNDQVAIDAAERKNPGVVYGTPAYEHTIRGLYFDFVRRHPGFALHVYLAKTAVVLGDAFRKFWFAFLLAPAMLLIRTRVQKEMRLFAVLLLPGLLLGAVPPILAWPFPQYEDAWLGAWGFASLLVVLWLAATIPWQRVWEVAATSIDLVWRALRPRARQSLAPFRPSVQADLRYAASRAGRDRGMRSAATILVVVCAAGLGLRSLVRPVRAASAYTLSQNTLTRAPVEHGPTLRTWLLAHRPTQWKLSEHTRAQRSGNGLVVFTTARPWSYQLVSPVLDLHPGAYGVVVEGELQSGGLDLGVVDVTKRAFLVQSLYSAQQKNSPINFGNGRMFAKFTLASDARIEFVFSNWAPEATSSRWRLETVSLVRQVAPCGCSPPDSKAWIAR